jgi:hypothetical protein
MFSRVSAMSSTIMTRMFSSGLSGIDSSAYLKQ